MTSLTTEKYQGPDLIVTDIIKLVPSLFAHAELKLWRAIDRTVVVPPMLKSALLYYIFNEKGGPVESSNNLPVRDTSTFRLLISIALMMELRKLYSHSEKKIGVFNKAPTSIVPMHAW